MQPDTICKTVCQHSRGPVAEVDMGKLLEIAKDYGQVKNYVYQRYGGIRSLSKLNPGSTVQNEMTASGLREQMGLPSVYFYMAVFEALRDIKGQWTRTKSAVLQRVNRNQGLSENEKHYLRYLLAVENAFEAVLNHKTVALQEDLQKKYDLLAGSVCVKKLNNYLCRQVRKIHVKPCTDAGDGFSLTEKAFRYGDHGIYITTKERRKRIFIMLTDGNQYARQIHIKLYPGENRVEIRAPINVRVKKHGDYTKNIGIAMGMDTMFVTDEGHVYGESLGEYQIKLAKWLRKQMMEYHPNNEAETGRKKYKNQKRRLEEQLHSYINMELNRFFRTEQPGIVYIPKYPKLQKRTGNKEINYSVNLWQRGYIKKRLALKCREQSVGLVEVFGKDISNECSRCGAHGSREEGFFYCRNCGSRMEIKENTAKNVRKRGIDHGSRNSG